MRARSVWIGALGVGLAASVVACGGGRKRLDARRLSRAASAADRRSTRRPLATSTAWCPSTASRRRTKPIKMNADPVCVKENPTPQTQETYEVADGKLANVFVYVKDGLGNYVYDAPAGDVTIDQKGCRYHPHVFGIRVGQELDIVNSDPTLHNIHALPKGNAEFNTGQPIQGMKTDAHLQREGSHGAVQVRRARLDERVRRRGRQSVLRGHRRGRQVLAQGSAARHVHDRSLAREGRHADRAWSRSAQRKPRKRTSRSRRPRPPTSS